MQEVKHYFVGTLGIEDYYSASLYNNRCWSCWTRSFNLTTTPCYLEAA
jgi:hypothetical protein